MSNPDAEQAAVRQVAERLLALFPNVRPQVVEQVVRRVHQGFADSTVRDFVPLLVERAAKQELIRGSGQLPVEAFGSPRLAGDASG